MKSLVYAIHLNCIEDTHCKLKTAISVLNMFVTLAFEVFYASTVIMKNVINGKILAMVWLQKILNAISVYFRETGVVLV